MTQLSRSVLCILFLTVLCVAGWQCTGEGNITSNTDALRADVYEVTIDSFRRFVEATGYVTTADSLEWSGVFDTTSQKWVVGAGANWERPMGDTIYPGNYPVTQVSYYDACAYCAWKGGRLPTASEWDQVAGDVVLAGNVWEGPFPIIDRGRDGYRKRVAPVGQFTPNAAGLHDLFGNVWEWTNSEQVDGVMIIKGGSFLCDDSYCSGYYPSRFQTTPKDSGLNHLGFRCVYPDE